MGLGSAREIYNLPCSPDVIAMAITCTMLFTWARCISRGESASPPQRLAADSVARACVACGLGFRVWGLGFGVWGLGFGVTVWSGPAIASPAINSTDLRAWGLGLGVWIL